MIDSATDTFEKSLYQMTHQQLSAKTCTQESIKNIKRPEKLVSGKF